MIQGSAAETKISFPDSIDKMQNAEYSFTQKLAHYGEGTFFGSGSIKLTYDHNLTGRLGILSNYDLKAYQCHSTPSFFKGTLQTTHNLTTRYTIGTIKTIGSVNLNGMHTNWYLGDYANPDLSKEYQIDDLIYTHYVDNAQNIFSWYGDAYVNIMGETITAHQIHWEGQKIYAGTICGIGTGPLINCSVDYYYEKQSGLLLATEATFLDYNSQDPSIYQLHTVSKTLISLKYEGQPDENDKSIFDNLFDRLFGENRRQAEAIMGIIAIIGAGLLAIHLINKRSLKWRSQALVEFEKKYGNLETIIEETKQEIGRASCRERV